MTSHPANTNSNRGYLAAFGSSLFLAITGIFIRYLTVNFKLPALVLTFWREFFVALALVVAFIIFKPVLFKGIRKNLPYLAAYGVVLALFNSVWTLSVAFNGAAWRP